MWTHNTVSVWTVTVIHRPCMVRSWVQENRSSMSHGVPRQHQPLWKTCACTFRCTSQNCSSCHSSVFMGITFVIYHHLCWPVLFTVTTLAGLSWFVFITACQWLFFLWHWLSLIQGDNMPSDISPACQPMKMVVASAMKWCRLMGSWYNGCRDLVLFIHQSDETPCQHCHRQKCFHYNSVRSVLYMC